MHFFGRDQHVTFGQLLAVVMLLAVAEVTVAVTVELLVEEDAGTADDTVVEDAVVAVPALAEAPVDKSSAVIALMRSVRYFTCSFLPVASYRYVAVFPFE